jgi:glycosyltransferase involved in cell wall biosynthesis
MNNYLFGKIAGRSPYFSWNRPAGIVHFEEILKKKLQKSISLSIVITNYNNERFIERLCRSVEQQEFDESDFEIVFVDDASSDRSLEIFCSFHFPNMRAVCLKKNSGNHGLPSNLGTLISKGKYLTFIDSDDCLHDSQSLKFAFRSMEGRRGMSISDVLIHLPEKISGFDWVLDLECLRPGLYIRRSKSYSVYELMEKCYAIGLRTIERQSLLDVGGWEERLGPSCDFGLVLKMALKYELHKNNHICYDYFIHDSNMSLFNNNSVLKKERKNFLTELLFKYRIDYDTLKINCSEMFWELYDIKRKDLESNATTD